MQIYLYAKSGHTIGLEATKRCAAIANLLKEFNPILCTSDFRAGAFAKDNLEIKKYVNIDVIRNLPNIMQRKDILIYDSNETNEEMRKEMEEFCSLLYEIKNDDIIVDTTLYKKSENSIFEKTLFFGDDDYNNLLLDLLKDSKKFDLNLLMGHYFFLGNEKIFQNHFSNVIDEEEYVQTIQNSKYLLTSSTQTAYESLSCGNFPVLFKREDKSYNDKLISKLNIPVIKYSNIDELINNFESTIKDYPTITNFEIKKLDDMILEVKEKIALFNKLTQL
ncbi:hypothetical protein [Arcobacter defluvii]|uniref:Uncharacterized protein n=1 Tax=Arcobacter defluvii TaxID=873191 RepID=A0AAE7BG15_9BACT|nr:hypothetical protein [Arcobacter defluvii]QKF78855.1 hypothetical protein ADFLV_2885 [Arcobacter defluvii]RXI30430.1 hypothetical protein CP964_11905 [Arcobacter defluvii]